ncbi:hypothetical protein ACJRO7_027767 [Eucalyptus globulus]|uniref:Uncharacterized protein n=1 Tax=Eucalyptus globulus TaxID=34317 RepID=A0ABD3JUR7_EUCGL
MENQADEARMFDMRVLKTNLPNKRGLSRYYSGKSRSFACMADVQCLEDLKKQERQDVKKRKYLERKEAPFPPYSCRSASSSTQCLSSCIGV